MNLELKNLSGTDIEISGELEAPAFGQYWQEAVLKVSARTKIDGYRQGKIPENVLISNVGEAEILEEAAEMALEDLWPKIIKEKNIEPIGKPEIVITKLARGNPLGFKIKSVTLPEIKLPNYKDIAASVYWRTEPEIKVENSEIDSALEYLQKARAKDDLPAGGSAEINDDFAKNLGDFQNLEALKANLAENIKAEKIIKNGEKKRMETLDSIAGACNIEVPPILVEFEKQKMVGELKENLSGIGIAWEHYLDHIKKTEEDLKKEWALEAEKRVRYGLTLREIAKAENVTVSEDELQNETMLILSKVPKEEAKSLDPQKLKDYAYGIIRNEKVFKILEQKE